MNSLKNLCRFIDHFFQVNQLLKVDNPMFRAKDIQVNWIRSSSEAKSNNYEKEEEIEENDANRIIISFILMLVIALLL